MIKKHVSMTAKSRTGMTRSRSCPEELLKNGKTAANSALIRQIQDKFQKESPITISESENRNRLIQLEKTIESDYSATVAALRQQFQTPDNCRQVPLINRLLNTMALSQSAQSAVKDKGESLFDVIRSVAENIVKKEFASHFEKMMSGLDKRLSEWDFFRESNHKELHPKLRDIIRTILTQRYQKETEETLFFDCYNQVYTVLKQYFETNLPDNLFKQLERIV